MINLKRNPIPQTLRIANDERVARLTECLTSGVKPPQSLLDSYRHPELKSHLVDESHGKCIYCESRVLHTYFGDVEHIKPKQMFPLERLTIENLGLACAICNNNKGEYWIDDLPLLNPYVDEVDKELIAFGYHLYRRPGSHRGTATISILKLNRPALLDKRRERIQLIEPLVEKFLLLPDGHVKELVKEELCQYAMESEEFSMVVKAFLKVHEVHCS